MIRTPYLLSTLGYKPSPDNPLLFVPPTEDPLFSVKIEDDKIYNEGEIQQLLIKASRDGGFRAGVTHAVQNARMTIPS